MNIWMASYEWHEHKHERAQALTHISIPWMRMRMWSIWYRARAFDRWSCVIYLYVCFIRHFNEQSYGFIWPFCDMCSNTAIESIYFVSLSLWCLSQINDCSAWCANERERARVCVCVWQSHELMITHMTINTPHRQIHVILTIAHSGRELNHTLLVFGLHFSECIPPMHIHKISLKIQMLAKPFSSMIYFKTNHD